MNRKLKIWLTLVTTAVVLINVLTCIDFDNGDMKRGWMEETKDAAIRTGGGRIREDFTVTFVATIQEGQNK